MLHLGYLWIGVGLLLTGLGRWVPELGLSALHALTVGALGTLILGMITRVSLGHTGRTLVVGRPVVAAYVLVTLSALVRVVAPLVVPATGYRWTLIVSGTCFSLAYGVFLAFARLPARSRGATPMSSAAAIHASPQREGSHNPWRAPCLPIVCS